MVRSGEDVTQMPLDQLAGVVSAYEEQRAHLEELGESIAAKIARLTLQQSENHQALSDLQRTNRRAVACWGGAVQAMHADPLYDFVQHGGRDGRELDDFTIARKGLLTSLHGDIDALHAYTDGLEEPGPVYARSSFGSYLGMVAPGARVVVSRSTDVRQLFVPMHQGIRYVPRQEKPDVTRVIDIVFTSSDVRASGLSKILHYGEEATAAWSTDLLVMSRPRQLTLWLHLTEKADTPDMSWLVPSPEVAAHWKELTHNLVLSIVNGRNKGASDKIALAERVLQRAELGFTDEERFAIEELIVQAKATLSSKKTKK